jgi:hypothetical protein
MATMLFYRLKILAPVFALASLLVQSAFLLGQPDYTHLDLSAQRLVAAVKPTPAELRWQQIPWELDLQEAMDLAKKEQRPIFLWAAGGRGRDGVPLERC